tara:strand:- start:24 stop:167 length:144 start_codon:yes stop_codon:yes gene_type:complete
MPSELTLIYTPNNLNMKKIIIETLVASLVGAVIAAIGYYGLVLAIPA